MGARLAVLVLPEPPYPAECGNALRDIQQIELLRRLGYVVNLLCVRPRLASSPAIDRNRAAREGVRVEFVSEHARNVTEAWVARARRKVGYLLPGNTAHPFAWWMTPYALAKIVPQRIAATGAHAVLLRSLFLELLPLLRVEGTVQIIVDCHDADVHLAREMVRTVSWWRSVGPAANYWGMSAVCRKFLPLADEIWAVSDNDAVHIRPFAGPARVLVVPSGVDEASVVPAAQPGCDDLCAMVANYSYGPNLNAARWLVRRVWPRVVESRRSAKLLLVGGGAEGDVCALAAATAGIEATGRVDDLTSVYANAGVMLAPLREGGGTRLKIVEAWKHGKAVMATSKGAEGAVVCAGVAAVEDAPEAFASRLSVLLGSRFERCQLAEAGRRFALRRLSYQKVLEHVACQSLLGTSTTVSRRLARG